MKIISACLLAAAALAGSATVQAADVGVSIGISQPGVYGRVDIGRFPQPAVIVPQPVLVMPQPAVAVAPQPVYLWVPPGHRKHWRKHCHEYGACGVPVYFVQDRWYQQHVMAPHRHGGYAPGRWRDQNGQWHDHDRVYGREDDHDEGRGHGRGHGRHGG